MTEHRLTEDQLTRLLEVGRSLVSELDLESLLRQVLETARDLTGARFAALGILDSDKAGLDRFLHVGIDEETRRRIGPLPRGRGVLGELIRDRKPLRLAEVGDHVRSYGFPPGHPPMHTFVGVPIQVHGEAFGNIYLTEKEGGAEFDERDEATLVILADWAAVAIANARIHEESESRRSELERAVQALDATISLSRVGSVETEIGDLLELIAKRCRALVDSRSVLLLAPDDAQSLVVRATAGEVTAKVREHSVSPDHQLLVSARQDGRVQHVHAGLSSLFDDLGYETSAPSLIVHMEQRGQSLGYLLALNPIGRSDFSSEDELVFASFASSAAISLATAEDAEQDRLRRSIEASEAERRRWARELHDETLQELAALKLMHTSALQTGDPEALRTAVERSSDGFDAAIDGLEHLINDLRPAALDELGPGAALSTLADKTRGSAGIEVALDVDLAFERGDEPTRHTPELETAVYRIVQECLTNVSKHADATSVTVSIHEVEGRVEIARHR